MARLDDKVALVTGAGRGIGRALRAQVEAGSAGAAGGGDLAGMARSYRSQCTTALLKMH